MQYVTKSEAARLLKVSLPTINRMIETGRLPEPVLRGARNKVMPLDAVKQATVYRLSPVKPAARR